MASCTIMEFTGALQPEYEHVKTLPGEKLIVV